MIDERNIQFTQFLTSRAEEIRHLTGVLESKQLNSNKFPYQILHKHLRRRAMSHNRYRIPSSLRKQMNIQQLAEAEDAQKAVWCRRHIRKVRLLQSSYQRRSRRVKWLETHLHQVKRMKMIDYQGYQVGLRANEKNWRAVHRYESHGCCVSEMSYYEQVLLQNCPCFIQEITKQEHLSTQLKQGQNAFQAYIYDKEILIGPATFIFNPNESGQLMIFFHPSMRTSLIDLLNGREIPYELKSAEISLFQLYGPQSYSLVNSLLQVLARLDQDNHQRLFYSTSIQYFSFNVGERLPRIQSETRHTYKQIKTLQDYMTSPQINVLQDQTQCEWDPENKQSFWDFNLAEQDRLYSIRFHTVTRGRYTHRKKNKKLYQEKQKELKKQYILDQKLKKSQKGPKPQEQAPPERDFNEAEGKKAIRWLLNEQVMTVDEKQKMEEEGQFLNILQNTSASNRLSLLLLPSQRDSLSQFGLGITIGVNQGQGILIWKLLNQLKLKPIGLRDLRQLAMENRVPYFPDDFPQTKAYDASAEAKYEEKLKCVAKTPPAKRVNHYKTLFPSPFRPIWSLVSHSTRIAYLTAFESIPKENALVVQPSAADMQSLLAGQFKVGVMILDEGALKNIGKTKDELKAYEDELQQVKLDRRLIGFVTYGNFSNKHGRGMATAHINAKICRNELLVLFRNEGSDSYYFAECTFE